MTNRASLFPIICVVALLLAPALARAADPPAATAVIPPPAPPAPHVVAHKPARSTAMHKRARPTAKAAASDAKPRHAAAAKKRAAFAKIIDRTAIAGRAGAGRKPNAVAQHHARHRVIERRSVVVRSVRPPPPNFPRDYAGGPMLAPDAPLPPLPPPWYDRARPAIAYAFPPPFMGPRGPMPWWVR